MNIINHVCHEIDCARFAFFRSLTSDWFLVLFAFAITVAVLSGLAGVPVTALLDAVLEYLP